MKISVIVPVYNCKAYVERCVRSIMSQTYICPHCGAEIKPKWYHFNTYMHWCGKRLVKCPVCRKMGYGKRKKD